MQAGAYFGEALQINDSLSVLDLSWNKLRLDGAVLLIHGLKVSEMNMDCMFLAHQTLQQTKRSLGNFTVYSTSPTLKV